VGLEEWIDKEKVSLKEGRKEDTEEKEEESRNCMKE